MFDLKLLRRHVRPFRSTLLPFWTRLQLNSIWQKGHQLRRHFLSPRQSNAFCIGLPKTGTTSIARMINEGRSAHEPETNILLYLHDQQTQGQITVAEQARALQTRDAMLWLDFESNHLLGLVIEGLVQAFPSARCVLTVREPRSWLESQINEQYEKGHIEPFASAYNRMFARSATTDCDEQLLKKGLYGVGEYLSYWSRQNLRVLRTVPPENLMVVWTQQITEQAVQIGQFLGVAKINYEQAHSNRRREKPLHLDRLVDSSYLEEQISLHTEEAFRKLHNQSQKLYI